MLIHILLCLLSVAGTAVLYTLSPTLSLWWLPLILVGGYVLSAALTLTGVFIFSFFERRATPSKVRRCFYRLIARIAEWVCLLCGIKVDIRDLHKLPKATPFLLVCNHLSNLDPLVTLAAARGFDLAFVSKPENFKIPFVGPIMRNASFLPIDRENPRNAVSTIKQAAKQITERSLCMGIYPEGTRNKTEEKLLPFHNGSFKIATTAKCPIAVLTLRYEKGSLPHTRRAQLQVIEVLDADYVSENRTDAISARVLSFIKNNL